MKRFLKGLMVLVFLIATFIPYIRVNAYVTTKTSYEFEVKATENEVVPADTDLSNYINSKKVNVFENTPAENTWLNLYREENGVYKYPKEITITSDENDSNPFSALMSWRGQTYDGVGTDNLTVINNYKVSYTEVTVTKAPHTVTFVLNGGTMTEASSLKVNDGNKVSRPTTDPVKADNLFVNWYANLEFTELFDFNTPITTNTNIYAKWSRYAQINVGITPDAGSWDWNVSPGDTGPVNSMVLLTELDNNQVTFTATPNEGYRFVGWYEGVMSNETHYINSHTEALLSSSSSYTATITKYVTNVMAVFEKDTSVDTSRVQIIMSENVGNNYGTFNVTGGAFGISINLNSSIAEFVDMGTTVTLAATPNSTHTFKGWYNAEEYDITGAAGLGVMGWRPIGEALSTNSTFAFTVSSSYYNIMPVFESRAGHNNIWTTSGGQIAVLYENRDVEQTSLDGEHWYASGIVVDYWKGDSITVKARANEGYHFVGWFQTDPKASVAEDYVREPVLSTDTTFTYQPSVTIVSGVNEPINYITAAFEKDTPIVTTHTVTFKDKDTILSTKTVNDGAKVAKPTTDPTKAKSVFAGWYIDPEFTTLFDFDNTIINRDTTIYAKFLTKKTIITDFIAKLYDTEEVPYDTDLASYTASKLWDGGFTDEETNNKWKAQFGEVNGVWQYAARTGLTYSFIGQETTDTEILNKYTVTYDQVVVTKASNPSEEPDEPTVYIIEEGNNQTYTKGSNKNIVIKASGDLSKLLAIEIDNGNIIDPANYELENGSTILILKSVFLENSSIGNHTITFKYDDGETSAKLTIANKDDDNKPISSKTNDNPNTGDNLMLYVSMLIISLFEFGGIIHIKKRIN